MRRDRWNASALALAMLCGATAALAQPDTDLAARTGPTAERGGAPAPLAQAPQQRNRDRRDAGTQEAAERRAEQRREDQTEQALEAERDAAGQRLDEARATEIAAEQGLIRARMVLGGPVRSAGAEKKIATVRDFAIDTDRNQIAAVVVSFGGNFGFGERYVAVPFAAFEPAEAGQGLTTDLTVEDLRTANTFTADDWPDMTSRDVVAGAHEQFGYEPYWTRGVEAERGEPVENQLPIKRAAKLVGRPVRSVAQNEQLGTLGDMVIDTREGRIVYGIFSRGGFLGFGEKRVIVPCRALSFEPAPRHFALDADEATVEALAFDNNNWPDLTDAQWAANLHRRLNEEPYWQTFGYVDPVAGPAIERETPRTHLEEAGVPDQQIRQIEQKDYPADRVEQALQQAYLEQGMTADEAARKAAGKADRIEQLRQAMEARPRELLRNAGLTEPEIDQLEAEGYVQKNVEQALEQAYLDAGLDEQAAKDLARTNAQRIVESMRFERQ